MKKRFFFTYFCLIVAFVPVLADDCSDALIEAKRNYNAGNYSTAKELFEYVQEECGKTYGSADTWIQKCNQALNPSQKQQTLVTPSVTLVASQTQVNAPAEGTTLSVRISSNRDWYIANVPANWCQVTKYSANVTLNVSSNPTSYVRRTSVQIKTTDGKKSLTIYVDQAAKTATATSNATPSSTSTSSAELSLSKTYITASSYGTTEYITITSNKPWEIQYPSASMYSVTRISNTLIEVVINQNTGGSRQDFFNIKTTDGQKVVKVSLTQTGTSASYQSTTNRRTSKSSSYTRQSSYRQYINNRGVFEVTWYSMRLGFLGYGFAYESSLMKLRFGPIQLSPLEIAVGANYKGNGLLLPYQKDMLFAYQPTIDAVIPVSERSAIYVGAGPTLDFIDGDVWFKIEAGWHFHWGRRCASSDFFMRYDGVFCIGTSIQWSTGW